MQQTVKLQPKEPQPSNQNLKKQVGALDAITMVIGIVIGSGIFFKSSPVFSNAGSPFLGIMAWIIGGLLTVASALTISEIATAIPKTGGLFVYIKELYSEKWAFLFGWVQSFIYVPGVTAALSIIFVTQATFFIPMSDFTQKILAISLIFFLILVNIASTKIGSKIQVVATIAKLIPIVIIIAFGFIKGTVGGVSEVSKVSLSGASLAGFGSAILGTLWAYDGWVGVANMAGELKNPSKDLPKSIILGLSITMIIYVLINIAIINVIPVDAVIASQTPASDAAVLMFGKSGAILISAGIMISIFGAMNGYLLTGVRVPFAMASEGLFPFADKLSYLHPQSNTPVLAFVLEGALAVLYVMSGSFEVLTTLAMFMVWFFFVMAVAGIFVLRKKFSHLNPAYKVPFYPFVPLVGIAGGIYILLSTLVTDFKTAVLGILITALGVPVYNHITKSKRA